MSSLGDAIELKLPTPPYREKIQDAQDKFSNTEVINMPFGLFKNNDCVNHALLNSHYIKSIKWCMHIRHIKPFYV
jgi:hypothetical protein